MNSIRQDSIAKADAMGQLWANCDQDLYTDRWSKSQHEGVIVHFLTVKSLETSQLKDGMIKYLPWELYGQFIDRNTTIWLF